MSVRGTRATRSIMPTRAALVRVTTALLSAILLIGLTHLQPAGALTLKAGTLTVEPGSATVARIGKKRITTLGEVILTVPRVNGVDVALQMRAKNSRYGYRAKLSFMANGSVAAEFTRVRSGVETALGRAVELGLKVKPGERIHFQATVAAKKRVRLYLRAWKDGGNVPAHWQHSATDSSSKRYSRAGYVYVRASSTPDAPATSVGFTTVRMVRYSAREAEAVGVQTTPAGSDVPFTVAVMPDTQDETLNSASQKFSNRTQWLAANRDKLNLKYVMHSGDVVNWGWLVPSQFDVAKAAVKELADAGIPYAMAIGNHDTAAVGWNNVAGSTGYGGSAYMFNPECPTRLGASQCFSHLLVRNTDAFNDAFPLASIRNVGGAFEAGKVDNIWTSFTDGSSGTKWLVLTLELWPRKDVVAWAADVVASHPDFNVLVQTHSYLTSGGGIDQSNGGYGATSGQYLYDNLIKKYANIKLVFSGHVGTAAKRVDTGVNGNRIVSYLECFHSPRTNPVRLVTIDPATGTVSTRIYAPLTDETWSQYSTTDSIDLVR